MKRFSRWPFRWTLVALLLTLMLALPWAALAEEGEGETLKLDVVRVGPASITVASGASFGATFRVENNSTGVDADRTFSGAAAVATTGGIGCTPTSASFSALAKDSPFTISLSCTAPTGPTTGSITVSASGTPSPKSGGGVCGSGGNKCSDSVSLTANVNPPSDTTPPVITLNASGTLGNNGWYVSDVIIDWSVSDPESSYSIVEGCVDQTVNYDTTGVTLNCVAHSAGGTSSQSVTIKRDATAPTIGASLSPASPALSGWYNASTGAPTVSFTCSDATSGLAGACPADYTFGEGENQSYSKTIYDNAGNSASAGVSDIDVDLTAPTLTWSNGPANDGSYYFGFVPAAPTCTAADVLSGPNGCTVTGYGTAVGSHTMTATAYDVAGNSKAEMRSYEVKAWEMYGFYQPVDMNGVWNTVKGGSTVPLKFEVFAGSLEFTDPSVIVQPLLASRVSCAAGNEDAIEELAAAAGNTVLRYDFADGQFIYNWKTPKSPGTCYKVTVSSMSGSSLTAAYFKLK